MKFAAHWTAVALAAAIAVALPTNPARAADSGTAARDDSKNSAKGAAGAAKPGAEASSGDEKPFDSVIQGLEPVKGLFTFYRRADDNKLLLEIRPDQLDQVFLFGASIDHSTGERGFYSSMMGADFPFMFHRVGKSVQLVVKNPSFVADAGTPQARATTRSFPDAILASTKILSKPNGDTKSILIDAADLLASRDYPGFAPALTQAYAPTNFSFDKEKSAVTAVKAFPENVLVSVMLHYQTDNFRSSTVTLADGRSAPIAVIYSLSSLPKTDYVPRVADDRVGHFTSVFQDFTSDHAASPYVRYIQRWNLQKQDPNAALSPPKQPIVYWLENTIPLEYRDAVREGVLLWNKAFERLGYKDAVVVKQMPDSADWDPADVRYSTIRWFEGVDATFAIGPRRTNPFTGEIYDADIGISEGIVRNARRFGEEYLSPVTPASKAAVPFAWTKDAHDECSYGDGLADQCALGMAEMDARGDLSPETEQKLMHQYIVELVAHEVGHTLGLRHNFHASTSLPTAQLNDEKAAEEIGQSGSVMDYNPIIVAAKGEKQGAFVPVTLGPYDYWAIEYAYKSIPKADEPAELNKIAARCAEPALQYGTDEDAQNTYSPLAADPLVNQYDASDDPLAYFQGRVKLVNELWSNMEARLAKPGQGYQIMRRALSRSMNDDYRSLLTSSKFVGGVYVHRDHAGDPNERAPFQPVPAATQRQAMAFLARDAFGEHAFQLPASLLDHLAAERQPGLDPAYWNTIRIDYPWHDAVLRVQKAILDRMLHPVTLGRVLDNELRFAPTEKPFRMADVFAGLNASIWSELDGPQTTITSLRRNLQREYLRDLVHLTLRDQPTLVDMGAGNPPAPVPIPEDATTLARSSLVRLDAKMKAKLLGKAVLDPTTRAHLQESVARIETALAAQMTRRVD